MNHLFRLTLLALVVPLFAACIDDEAPNAECDITGVDASYTTQLKSVNILVGDPTITNTTVVFTINRGEERTAFAPVFTLTEGATLFAIDDEGNETANANGMERDFSIPQYYKVYSEDGQWSKTYRVSFNYFGLVLPMSFENALPYGNYFRVYEIDETSGDTLSYWDSGNAGYSFTGMTTEPYSFPTAPATGGVSGNCMRLVTCNTGSFGHSVDMPIAAGSLFIGEFRSANAVTAPLLATRFGLQLLAGVPKTFSGYYKYTSGDEYQDANENILEGVRDTCDIYAVVYEVDNTEFVPLNGTNILTSDRIVCIARIDDPGEPSEWTYFEEPFEYKDGKSIDRAQLNAKGYAIAVVASSSRSGHLFAGAIGSELYIDEFNITWMSEEDEEE